MPTLVQTDLTQSFGGLRLPVLSVVALRVAWIWALWSRRRLTRRQLRHLPQYRLSDIGIFPADALAEAGKPFWRP